MNNTLQDEALRQAKRHTTPTKALAQAAIQAIFEKKGKDVTIMDINEVSGMADYFILCNGDSPRQIKAIADGIREDVREATGENAWRSEGYEAQEWILLDYVDVVIHVFNPEKRVFYSLERLWSDAPREEVPDENHEVQLLAD